MGYSSRYHAASLAAVFLALAIGILIGVGLGDNVVSSAEKDLSSSLEADIDDARSQADDLQSQLDRERQFAARAFPALIGNTLSGKRIAVLAFGSLPPELASNIEGSVEPAGGELTEVSVVAIPADGGALASALGVKLKPGEEVGADSLRDFGEVLGRQFAHGRGRALERARGSLYTRSSGESGKVNGVVITRAAVDDLDEPKASEAEAFMVGLTAGIRDAGVPVVAVEREDTGTSSVPFFSAQHVTTVDDVDLTAGRVATVFALLGADGNFGVKATAQSLLPELLTRKRRGG